MRVSNSIYCFVIFLFSCLHKKNDNIYDPDNFIRVTSHKDSIKGMRVIYVSRVDKNRNMIRSYFNDGSPIGIGYYYNGKKDGHWIQFSESKISYEGSFSESKKIGIHKYYFPNGQPSIIEEYKNGQIINKTEYAKDGLVLYTEKYETK